MMQKREQERILMICFETYCIVSSFSSDDMLDELHCKTQRQDLDNLRVLHHQLAMSYHFSRCHCHYTATHLI